MVPADYQPDAKGKPDIYLLRRLMVLLERE
jgi:hypothetical protein